MNLDTRFSDVLHVLLHMAHVKEPLTSEVLARSMGTNPAVFRRTMAGLRDAGFVRSEKGHGGGWELSRPLNELTLLAVYEALGHPTLFALGNRNGRPQCTVEKNVNAVLAATMAEAAALFVKRFSEITLDEIAPARPVSIMVHAKT